MKNMKIKILEATILTTIIISLIVIFIFAKNTLDKKPQLSETNKIQNYSTSRIFKYNALITDSFTYAIPYQELIDLEQSTMNKYLTSTDNIINTYTEKIKIKYNILLPEQNTIITNYCNTYDTIELEYKFQCIYENNTLSISNTIYLNKLNTESITNNHNVIIPITIKKDTLLNEYLKQLNDNLIYPIEVTTIE